MNCGLTILKLARDLQQVLSSQDPLTPWHLHSTFMFRSRSCKRFLLAFFLYLYLLDIFHIDSLLLYFSCYFCFVIAADVGFSLREIFLPRFPPQPYYCGCPRIMESTFQIFCLWRSALWSVSVLYETEHEKNFAERIQLVKISHNRFYQIFNIFAFLWLMILYLINSNRVFFNCSSPKTTVSLGLS